MTQNFLSCFLTFIFIFTQSCRGYSAENFMQNEIQHVVILMLENRPFDNVLSWLCDDANAPQNFIPANIDPHFRGLTDETLQPTLCECSQRIHRKGYIQLAAHQRSPLRFRRQINEFSQI